MNALVPITPDNGVDAYRVSTDAAELCKAMVVASAQEIQGRRYIKVEGWQAIAVAHGCAASARDVRRVDGGISAIGEVRRMSDGVVIAEAEGFVGEDEETWFGGVNRWGKQQPKRADYAIRAMAQTRAISRACRSAFAHVVVMMNAGLSTTPAEEVPIGGFDDGPAPAPEPRQQRQTDKALAKITDEQRDVIAGLAQAADMGLQVICEGYKIASLKDLPASKYAKLVERLKADAAARGPERQAKPEDAILAEDVPF